MERSRGVGGVGGFLGIAYDGVGKLVVYLYLPPIPTYIYTNSNSNSNTNTYTRPKLLLSTTYLPTTTTTNRTIYPVDTVARLVSPSPSSLLLG